jgi:endonuclease/exonuclease/phosphatase family metal-dependent hydrolase
MFNSHYDHRGHEAKEYSSVVLLNKIMEVASGYPVVLTGDFNTDEKTPGYQRLIESGIVDDTMLALQAGKRENWEYFSMSNYKPIETVRKNHLHIDHVFYTPSNSKVITWKLILDSCDGIFGSDHLPIVIDWKIAN